MEGIESPGRLRFLLIVSMITLSYFPNRVNHSPEERYSGQGFKIKNSLSLYTVGIPPI
jgi:hypothetical protein